MDIKKMLKTINESDVHYAKQDFNRVINYIKKYNSEHPDVNSNEISELIEDEFIDISNKYYEIIERLAGSKVQLLIRDYLLQNESVLKNIYQRLKNQNLKKETNVFYSYDTQKSSKLLVKELLFQLRETFKDRNMHPSSEEEYNYLKSSLVNAKNVLMKHQKEDNIEILQIANDFFNDYGSWDILLNKQNSQLQHLWLEGLQFDKNEIKNFFTSDNLEKRNLDELSALNVFWQNKYSKEANSVGFGYFVFEQLNLANNLPNLDIKISDNTIKNLLMKYNVLDRLCTQIYNMKINGDNPNKLIKKLEAEYHSTFAPLLPELKNTLQADLPQCINRFMAIQNTYAIKSNLTCGIIMDFVDNKKLKNWGYVNDNINNELNSIQTNNSRIIIGIDYPGFNRPIHVHISRQLLQDALINMKQTTTLPVYEGHEDFFIDSANKEIGINRRLLQNHICLPFEKRHKKFLQTKSLTKDNYKYNFLQHLKFLSNPDKFPEHLKGPNR